MRALAEILGPQVAALHDLQQHDDRARDMRVAGRPASDGAGVDIEECRSLDLAQTEVGKGLAEDVGVHLPDQRRAQVGDSGLSALLLDAGKTGEIVTDEDQRFERHRVAAGQFIAQRVGVAIRVFEQRDQFHGGHVAMRGLVLGHGVLQRASAPFRMTMNLADILTGVNTVGARVFGVRAA